MTDPINHVRRADRAVTDDAWIRARLKEAPFGVVATEFGGQPFINPVNFVYDEAAHAIYFHTSAAGRIFSNIRSNPRVCFNIARMGSLRGGEDAASFDVEYESIVVFGEARILEDEPEKLSALYKLTAKYFPSFRFGAGARSISTATLARTAVYSLRIDSWSAKRNPRP